MTASDVLHIPSAHVIDCRHGLDLEKFVDFLLSTEGEGERDEANAFVSLLLATVRDAELPI